MKGKLITMAGAIVVLALVIGLWSIAAEKEKSTEKKPEKVQCYFAGTLMIGSNQKINYYSWGVESVIRLYKLEKLSLATNPFAGAEIDISGLKPIETKAFKVAERPDENRNEQRDRFRYESFNGSFDLPKEPGFYLLVSNNKQEIWENNQRKLDWHANGQIYVVTNLALHAKRDYEKILLLASEGKEGKLAGGVELKFYNSENKEIGKLKTEENGSAIFKFDPKDNANRHIYIIAEKNNNFAMMQSALWWNNQAVLKSYFYSDRPVYRPAQKVLFKAILRSEENSEYSIPKGKVKIEIRDPRWNPTFTKELDISEFGTISGEFELGEEPPLGHYNVNIFYNDRQYYGGFFKVEEYKKPEYKIAVSTEKDSYLFGDKIVANVKADYYFGSPVVEGKGQYRVYRQPRYYYYWYPWRRYNWYYAGVDEKEQMRNSWKEMVQQGEFITDAEGKAIIEYKIPEKKENPEEAKRKNRWYYYAQNYNYIVEAVLTDKSRREVSEAASVPVSETEFYLQMYTSRWMYTPADKVNLTIRAMNLAGSPVKNKDLEFTLYRDNYTDNKEDYKKQFSKKLKTDEKGVATIEFMPDIKGRFRVEVTAEDSRKKKVEGVRDFWVSDETYNWPNYDFTALEIVTDKDTYAPGDDMLVLVTGPKKLTNAVISIDGTDMIEHQVFKFKNGVQLFKFKVTKQYMPNVNISVMAAGEGSQFLSRAKMVVIPPEENFLTVTIKADKDKYKPREEGTFEVEITDSKGNPVKAELSLGVVDESIFAIASSSTPDIRQFFYGPRYSRVMVNSSFWGGRGGGGWVAEADNAEGLGGREFALQKDMKRNRWANAEKDKGAEPADAPGGGGKFVQAEVREYFPDTALWLAHVTTDDKGRAVVKTEMPDSLTTWKFTVRVITKDTKVGQGDQSALVRKDLIIRLQTPRALVQSDNVTISAVVHNYLSESKKAKVTLKAKGIEIGEDATQMIELPKNSDMRVDWKLSIDKALPIEFVAEALTNEESDAMKLTIPVLPHGIEKIEAKSGMLVDEGTEVVIDVPKEIIPEATDLKIMLSPSVSNTMFDALEYLVGYPYGCVEQTMSRFLPDVMVAQVMQKVGKPNKKLEEELPKMISQGLQRLYSMQHGDGGWGWWTNDKTHPFMTAYVVYGLTLAQQADHQVDANILNRGIAKLKHMVANEKDENIKAYMLFALSFSKNADEKQLAELMKASDKLNDYSLSILSIALDNQGKKEDAKTVVDELVKHAKDDGNLCAWTGKVQGHGSWMDNPVETTAYALRALVRANPDDQRLGRVIIYLSSKRQGNRWYNTKDTAAVVYALADYVVMSKELFPDMEVSVNINEKKESWKVDRDNLFDKGGRTITLKAEDLKLGERNILTIKRKGKGRIYYSAILSYYSVEKKLTAAANGFTVEREYFKMIPQNQNGAITFKEEKLADGAVLKSGDRVKVRLWVSSRDNQEYIMVEDYFPSGFEVAQDMATPSNNWWYNQQEFRDEKAVFFCTYYWAWWRGDNKKGPGRMFEYVLRAETPGIFHALPARAGSMYTEGISGNSDETVLEIKD